jgi:hypothetical protein
MCSVPRNVTVQLQSKVIAAGAAVLILLLQQWLTHRKPTAPYLVVCVNLVKGVPDAASMPDAKQPATNDAQQSTAQHAPSHHEAQHIAAQHAPRFSAHGWCKQAPTAAQK